MLKRGRFRSYRTISGQAGKKVAVVILALLWPLFLPASARSQIAREDLGSRRFHFTYEARVVDIPAEAKLLEMWVPIPREEDQQLLDLRIEGTTPPRIGRLRESGDRFAYMRVERPRGSSFLRQQVLVVRKEISAPADFLSNKSILADIDRQSFSLYLGANGFIVINDEVRSTMRRETAGAKTVIGKARSLYDWVAGKMVYDKSGRGWGLGDIRYCLKVGRGNCTDFHSLFIALARAAGIPARWNIGFPIAYGRGDGETRQIKGYHCWAEFFLPGSGWIPVDISEGDKHPELRDYFFGHLSGNRILYTRGRVVRLEPDRGIPPLNYFIYPYVLVDGRPHDKVEKHFSYRDS